LITEPITIPMLFSTEKELLTPPLNGLILPGVIRNSLLTLARQWNQFKVTERTITMKEIIQLNSKNRVRFICNFVFSFCFFLPYLIIYYYNKFFLL